MILNRLNIKSKYGDIGLMVIIAIILAFGLLMLASASVAVGLNRFGDGGFFIKRQLEALLIGLVAGYACYRLPFARWREWSFALFAVSLVLLILVFIPGLGLSGKGAARWINLGIANFQPSELVKLTLILYLSAWLSERGARVVADFKAGLVPFVGLMGVLFILIISQPDLGTLLVITWIGVVLYFVGGAHVKHLLALAGSGSLLLLLMIKIEPYRLARLTAFLDPSHDPQGVGYHINQAMLAIGSGGWLGVGLGQSRQKFLYLPEVTGDSIFAVIAEELGFVICALVIALFLAFLWRGLKIARNAPDEYSKMVAIGITAWIVGQAFLNIGAITSLLPLTGIPLPLISYGGTALVTTLMGLGILLNISKSSRV
ncbi:MAG: putative lipid II flippase FtsW [Patescibacteria group bacterium]